MLTNLIKHEMRATGKAFMWLYIAFAVIVVVNVLFVHWGPANTESVIVSASNANLPTHTIEMSNSVPNAFQTTLAVLYFLSIVAMAIGTVVVIILRFYRNLLGDEGYLMMTLPVSREQLIFSKLLVATIWAICSGVLIFLSVLLLIAGSGSFTELLEGIKMTTALGFPLGQWITVIVITMVVSIIAGILMLYASMAIGPNLLKNRLGGSILAFIIIAVISQIVTVVTMIAPSSGSNGGPKFIEGVIETIPADGSAVVETPVLDQVFNLASMSAIISSAVIAIVCWFLTRYMLKRKLNLS
jgi:hypothetical protein